MFDVISYVMGVASGKKSIEITGGITCTDDGQGNVTITEEASE